MPSLRLFAVCEKAILDEEGVPSLIALLRHIVVLVSPGEIRKDLTVPKEWATFALWDPAEEDRGKSFVQVVRVLFPDQSPSQAARLKFEFEGSQAHQNRINMVGFPVGQPGCVRVETWLESDSRRVGEAHSWKIVVEHHTVSP